MSRNGVAGVHDERVARAGKVRICVIGFAC